MKKALITAASIAVVLAFVLSGCAPIQTPAPAQPQPAATQPPQPVATTAPEKVTISFWNGVGAPENAVMSKLIKQFNETNKDNIVVEESVMDWAELYSKILLDYTAGNAPDLLTMQQTNILQNVDLGILAPLDDQVAKYGFKKDDYVPGAWDGTLVNGKQYAIPFDMHPLALYYNTKLFQEAGLDPDKPPTNKEEFLNALQKLTKADGKQWGLGLSYSGGIPFRTWMSLLWQHKGSDVLTADHTKAAFNTPAGVESLQFLQDLVQKYKVIPPEEQSPDDDFAKGIVAMDISGPWSMYDFNKVDGLEYKTAPLPVIFDQPAAWANSHTLVMPNNKDPKKVDAAMKLARFLADNSMTWTSEAGHLPVIESIVNSDEFKKLEKSQAFAKSLETAHYYPAIVKQSEVFGREATSPFVVMMETALLNKGTAQDAIAAAEKAVNDILAKK